MTTSNSNHAGSEYFEESLFISLNSTDKLHLKRFCGDAHGPVVFLLHGSIENGKIFYSRSGKGLAPFLAKNGFDVFVADLRGRGGSTPSIGRHAGYGLTESIHEEIPVFMQEVKRIRNNAPMCWMAHSWGGILLLCYYAHNPQAVNISSMVFFGTKRRIRVTGWKKFWLVDVSYNLLFSLVVALNGFVNVKWFRAGSDNETRKAHRQTYHWVTSDEWRDEDGFDYLHAFRKLSLPPILFITGSNDEVLGHQSDVRLLMEEIGQKNDELYVAGKSNSNLHDYDHVTLLTHPDAPNDHFGYVLDWVNRHSTAGVV